MGLSEAKPAKPVNNNFLLHHSYMHPHHDWKDPSDQVHTVSADVRIQEVLFLSRGAAEVV